MTWNDHVRFSRAAAEFMGLAPPQVSLGFEFLDAPPPKVQRCRRPPAPAAPYPAGHIYHSRSIGRRPMPNSERLEMLKNVRQLRAIGVALGPPRTYGECPPKGEPCGHVSCRFHLGVNVNEETGAVTLTHPVPDADPSRAHLIQLLSPRDRSIKARIDQGESDAEIAAAMGLRERSVSRIRKRTRAKLNAEPELDILGMKATCALRVADEGSHSLEEVAELMGGVDKALIHRVEAIALAKIRAAGMLSDEG